MMLRAPGALAIGRELIVLQSDSGATRRGARCNVRWRVDEGTVGVTPGWRPTQVLNHGRTNVKRETYVSTLRRILLTTVMRPK